MTYEMRDEIFKTVAKDAPAHVRAPLAEIIFLSDDNVQRDIEAEYKAHKWNAPLTCNWESLGMLWLTRYLPERCGAALDGAKRSPYRRTSM